MIKSVKHMFHLGIFLIPIIVALRPVDINFYYSVGNHTEDENTVQISNYVSGAVISLTDITKRYDFKYSGKSFHYDLIIDQLSVIPSHALAFYPPKIPDRIANKFVANSIVIRAPPKFIFL